GRPPPAPRAPFPADSEGSPLSWPLPGPAGRPHTAEASASSRRCGPAEDKLPPRLTIVEPRPGAVLATRTPGLQLVYEDDGAVDLSSLRITLDGIERTAWFAVGPHGAVAAAEPARTLEQGKHRIEASLRDDAGHTANAAVAFTVDTIAPQVTVVEPGAGTVVSVPTIDVKGGVVDATAVMVSVAGIDASVN